MINAILNALLGNPYLFFWLLGILAAYALGWAIVDETITRFDIKAWQVGAIFAGLWAIIGGLFLVFIWALLTISTFFGIPLLILLALLFVIAVAGILLRR